MNWKLTIRLIGYSLIAIWSVWLIGRPGDVDPVAADTSAVAVARESAAAGEQEPPSVEESERSKAIRVYIDRMVSTDDQIDRLIQYVRQTPDDPAWSAPIRSAITEVIRVTERAAFESGELYVECGGLLCFIRGDLNMKTTLTQLPLSLWSAANRGSASFAATRSQKSDKYGWVFFVAAPQFDIPSDL